MIPSSSSIPQHHHPVASPQPLPRRHHPSVLPSSRTCTDTTKLRRLRLAPAMPNRQSPPEHLQSTPPFASLPARLPCSPDSHLHSPIGLNHLRTDSLRQYHHADRPSHHRLLTGSNHHLRSIRRRNSPPITPTTAIPDRSPPPLSSPNHRRIPPPDPAVPPQCSPTGIPPDYPPPPPQHPAPGTRSRLSTPPPPQQFATGTPPSRLHASPDASRLGSPSPAPVVIKLQSSPRPEAPLSKGPHHSTVAGNLRDPSLPCAAHSSRRHRRPPNPSRSASPVAIPLSFSVERERNPTHLSVQDFVVWPLVLFSIVNKSFKIRFHTKEKEGLVEGALFPQSKESIFCSLDVFTNLG